MLGFWLAFNVLNGIYYYTVYAVTILGVVWLRAIRARSGASRWRYLIHTFLAAGVFLDLVVQSTPGKVRQSGPNIPVAKPRLSESVPLPTPAPRRSQRRQHRAASRHAAVRLCDDAEQ